MIQTSLTNFILYNLCGLLLGLGLLWLVRVMHTRILEHRRRRHRVVCGICGHLFEDLSRESTVDCPACHRKVERQQLLEL